MRLPQSQLKAYRAKKLAEQDNRCAISGYTLSADEAVADHCHKTGHHRGILHRGVNSMLGVIENNMKRFGLTRPQLFAMLAGMEAYLSKDYSNNPLHYTYRTEEEKRVKRNTVARKKRAAAKVNQ